MFYERFAARVLKILTFLGDGQVLDSFANFPEGTGQGKVQPDGTEQN